MVRLYEEDVWGDSIHPGGMELTARMASSVEIGEHCTVLDVASGKGETALFLAREYGCRTVGVDLSMKMLSRARQRAIASSTADLLAFLAVDAASAVSRFLRTSMRPRKSFTGSFMGGAGSALLTSI
jgi:cyclopropane fatty-acyl-phospholipid synthase-like methyltransferase